MSRSAKARPRCAANRSILAEGLPSSSAPVSCKQSSGNAIQGLSCMD